VAARTKLLTRYDPVLSEDDEWAQVTKALSDVFAGKNPPAPSYEEREAELGGHDAGLERKGSAWRHTNFIATVMGTAGLLWCYFLPAVFGGTGRAKIKSGMVATLMLGGALFLVCYGPKYFFFFFFFFREDVDDATSEASSVGEAEQIGGDDSKDELEALKKDMGKLKKVNAERSRPADLPSPAKPLPEPPTHTMSAAGVGLDPQSSPFAAPEIYRSMRAAGAASVREWLNLSFQASRTSDTWVDLWGLATEVDYALSTAPSQADKMRVLATVDRVEIALRRLSSYIYETRTRDRTGARAMLAVLPPGEGTDVAPSWLIKESTEHSRMEHRRNE